MLALTNAPAQTPQITNATVEDYGIYTAESLSKQAAPGTATGTVTPIDNITLAATTHTIPAQIGVRFGFHFTLSGEPDGATVTLHEVTIFPAPGLTNPSTQQTKAKSEFDWTAILGKTTFKGYTFQHDWELVPGTWTLQVWYQGRELAEQSFNVVKQ
jgi:hypothetical protein